MIRLNRDDLNEIDEIIIEGDFFNCELENKPNSKKMILIPNINGNIIDKNFNILEERIANIEATINLRILGNLEVLNNKINK